MGRPRLPPPGVEEGGRGRGRSPRAAPPKTPRTPAANRRRAPRALLGIARAPPPRRRAARTRRGFRRRHFLFLRPRWLPLSFAAPRCLHRSHRGPHRAGKKANRPRRGGAGRGARGAALLPAAGPVSPWRSRRAGRRRGPPPVLTGSGLAQWGGGGPALGGGGGANRRLGLVDVRVGGGGCSPFSPVRGGAGGGRRYAQPRGEVQAGPARRGRCGRAGRGGTHRGQAGPCWGRRAAIVPLSARCVTQRCRRPAPPLSRGLNPREAAPPRPGTAVGFRRDGGGMG